MKTVESRPTVVRANRSWQQAERALEKPPEPYSCAFPDRRYATPETRTPHWRGRPRRHRALRIQQMVVARPQAQADQRARIGHFLRLPAVVSLIPPHRFFTGLIPRYQPPRPTYSARGSMLPEWPAPAPDQSSAGLARFSFYCPYASSRTSICCCGPRRPYSILAMCTCRRLMQTYVMQTMRSGDAIRRMRSRMRLRWDSHEDLLLALPLSLRVSSGRLPQRRPGEAQAQISARAQPAPIHLRIFARRFGPKGNPRKISGQHSVASG